MGNSGNQESEGAGQDKFYSVAKAAAERFDVFSSVPEFHINEFGFMPL
jgi:hypothetical protein